MWKVSQSKTGLRGLEIIVSRIIPKGNTEAIGMSLRISDSIMPEKWISRTSSGLSANTETSQGFSLNIIHK